MLRPGAQLAPLSSRTAVAAAGPASAAPAARAAPATGPSQQRQHEAASDAVYCKCRTRDGSRGIAVRRTVGPTNTKGNAGRDFYTCALARGDQCGFFEWVDARKGEKKRKRDDDDHPTKAAAGPAPTALVPAPAPAPAPTPTKTKAKEKASASASTRTSSYRGTDQSLRVSNAALLRRTRGNSNHTVVEQADALPQDPAFAFAALVIGPLLRAGGWDCCDFTTANSIQRQAEFGAFDFEFEMATGSFQKIALPTVNTDGVLRVPPAKATVADYVVVVDSLGDRAFLVSVTPEIKEHGLPRASLERENAAMVVLSSLRV